MVTINDPRSVPRTFVARRVLDGEKGGKLVLAGAREFLRS
jgi:hypothetical protein